MIEKHITAPSIIETELEFNFECKKKKCCKKYKKGKKPCGSCPKH